MEVYCSNVRCYRRCERAFTKLCDDCSRFTIYDHGPNVIDVMIVEPLHVMIQWSYKPEPWSRVHCWSELHPLSEIRNVSFHSINMPKRPNDVLWEQVCTQCEYLAHCLTST